MRVMLLVRECMFSVPVIDVLLFNVLDIVVLRDYPDRTFSMNERLEE